MQTNSIHFSAQHDKEQTIEMGNLRWEIHSKNLIKRIYISLLSIGVILFLCFLERKNPDMYQLMIFLGMAASIAAYLEFTFYFRRKSNYGKAILTIAERFENYTMPVSYEFSVDLISYRDAERYLEVQWNALKHYSFYKDHLLIWQGASALDTFVFKEGEEGVDSATYARILELVKIKLPLK